MLLSNSPTLRRHRSQTAKCFRSVLLQQPIPVIESKKTRITDGYRLEHGRAARERRPSTRSCRGPRNIRRRMVRGSEEDEVDEGELEQKKKKKKTFEFAAKLTKKKEQAVFSTWVLTGVCDPVFAHLLPRRRETDATPVPTAVGNEASALVAQQQSPRCWV